MSASTPRVRGKIITALELTGIGVLDPLPAEEAAQGAIWIAVAAEVACDPIRCRFDPHYDHLATPKIPYCFPKITRRHVGNLFDPEAPAKVVTHLRHSLEAQMRVASAEMCILHTVFRRHSADELGDRAAYRAQEAHRLDLIEILKGLQAEANETWAGLKTLLKKHRVKTNSITPKQFRAYQEHLDEHSFPKREELLFKAVGLTDVDIHWLRTVGLLAQAPKRPVSFHKMIDQIMEINTYRDVYECDCRGHRR